MNRLIIGTLLGTWTWASVPAAAAHDEHGPAPVPAAAVTENVPAANADSDADAPRVELALVPTGARPGARDVLQRFLDHVLVSSVYPPSAVEFVRERGAAVSPGGEGEFLAAALAVLSEEYRTGLDLVEKEDAKRAAEVFETLSASVDPFIAVASAVEGARQMIDLEEMERCRAMLDHLIKSRPDIESYTTEPDRLFFMLGYAQVHTLFYDSSERTLTDFLNRYPEAPERLRMTATQIVTELSRRVPGQLGDVRDLMQYARRRIDIGRVDDETISRQKEAVDLLTAMIDDAEQQEKNQGSCSKCGGKKCKGGSKCKGPPSGAQEPGSGAQQSTLPGGEAREGELRRVRARPGAEWGRMPPREREQILQTLQRRLPSQYRELLEQYYHQLARDAQPQ